MPICSENKSGKNAIFAWTFKDGFHRLLIVCSLLWNRSNHNMACTGWTTFPLNAHVTRCNNEFGDAQFGSYSAYTRLPGMNTTLTSYWAETIRAQSKMLQSSATQISNLKIYSNCLNCNLKCTQQPSKAHRVLEAYPSFRLHVLHK